MSRAMHTKAEIRQWLDSVSDEVVAQGVIPYMPKIEMRYKKKHPQKRFVLVCDDDHASRLYAARDRIITAIENKSHALDIMCALWEAPKDAELQNWRQEP